MVMKTDAHTRLEKRMLGRLRKMGMKLIKKRGEQSYAILTYSEAVRGWIEADGMFPTPYSLTLEDVIRLTNEYLSEHEVEQLNDAA